MKRLTRVERAARAIHRSDERELKHYMGPKYLSLGWNDISPELRDDNRRRAKAALGVKS